MAVSYRESPYERIVDVNWGTVETADVINVLAGFNSQITDWQPCSFEIVEPTTHIVQASNGLAMVGPAGQVRVDVDFVYFLDLGATGQVSVLVVTAAGVEHRSTPTSFTGLVGFGLNQLSPVDIGPGAASLTIEARIITGSSEEKDLIIQASSIAEIRWSPGAFPP